MKTLALPRVVDLEFNGWDLDQVLEGFDCWPEQQEHRPEVMSPAISTRRAILVQRAILADCARHREMAAGIARGVRERARQRRVQSRREEKAFESLISLLPSAIAEGRHYADCALRFIENGNPVACATLYHNRVEPFVARCTELGLRTEVHQIGLHITQIKAFKPQDDQK